jgi:hypothetical protein
MKSQVIVIERTTETVMYTRNRNDQFQTSNFYRLQHDRHGLRHTSPEQQSAHDRAYFYVLVGLAIVCMLCMLVAKMHSQDNRQDEPKSAPASTSASTSAATAPANVPPVTVPVKPETPKPSPYQPTPEQSKDLRIAQLEAITAQQTWSAAAMKLPEYQAFNAAVNRIGETCLRIRQENKWPTDVQCDINQNPIVFGVSAQQQPQTQSQSPVPPEQKSEKKK